MNKRTGVNINRLLIAVGIITALCLISFTSAFSTNSFNNSLSIENITIGTIYGNMTQDSTSSQTNTNYWEACVNLTLATDAPHRLKITTDFSYGALPVRPYGVVRIRNSTAILEELNDTDLNNIVYTNNSYKNTDPYSVCVADTNVSNTGSNYGQVDLAYLNVFQCRSLAGWSCNRAPTITINNSNYAVNRYISIPSTVETLTNAYFNLSGFVGSYYNMSTIYGVNTSISATDIIRTNDSYYLLDSGDFVIKFNLTWGYVTTYDISARDTTMRGIAWDSVTNKFWAVGNGDDRVYRFDSSWTYDNLNFSIASQETAPYDLTLVYPSATGFLYVVGTQSDAMNIYNLTGSYIGQVNTEANPLGIAYDAPYFWVTASGNDRIKKYSSGGVYQDEFIDTTGAPGQYMGLSYYNNSLYTASLGTYVKSAIRTNPMNVNVTLNNNRIYNYSGVFNLLNQKSSFVSLVTTYLNSCSYVGGNCLVPITFESESPGRLMYADALFANDGYLANNISYTTSVYETSRQNYSINVTYDPLYYSNVEAVFYYNGTAYTPTKLSDTTFYVFSNIIDIPTVNLTTNYTFYWRFALTNNTGTNYINSETYTQTVNPLIFQICNSTFNNTLINITTYTQTSPFYKINASIYSSWSYWIGTGNTKKNYTYQDANNNVSSFKFCASTNATYYIDADMQFNSPTYSQNYYYYRNASFNTTITEQPIYLLNSSIATITQLTVKNELQRGISDVVIYIQLYDVGTNSYRTIGMAKTNYDGNDIAYLNWYDSFYKFIGVRNGQVLFSYDPYKVASTPQTFKVGTTYSFNTDKFSTLQYSLYYNNVTNNIVLSFVDPTGKITGGCLRVAKTSVTSNTILYDTCLNSTSGSLSYNLGNESGTINAQFYATGSFSVISTIQVIKQISETTYENLGKLDAGVLALILVGTCAFFGLFSPVLAVIFAIAGYWGAMALGFVNWQFNLVFITMSIIGGYLAWKLRN